MGSEKFATEQGKEGRVREFVGAGGSDKVGRKDKFLHVVTSRRDFVTRELLYVVLRTFTQRAAMEKWIEQEGQPVWLFESGSREIVVWGLWGVDGAKRWNSGVGWVVDDMPSGRLVDERRERERLGNR